MIWATLDVNMLVSGFTRDTGVPSELIGAWLGRRFALALSEHILLELSDVWNRPYWRAHYQVHEAERALTLLRARAILVIPDPTVHGIAPDDEADVVLATAVAGGAQYLVTGDKHLQALGGYQGVVILTPHQFLDLLERDA